MKGSAMQRGPDVFSTGFSLVELVIVLAIIGVLSALALPSYSEYLRRGHRVEARTGLLHAAQWLERAATANGVYPLALPAALTWQDLPDKRYTIGFADGNSPARYTLVATRKAGPQRRDRCGDYTLSHDGRQGNLYLAEGSAASDCWRR